MKRVCFLAGFIAEFAACFSRGSARGKLMKISSNFQNAKGLNMGAECFASNSTMIFHPKKGG